jgi:hydrogenase nickel incorporation protein HypA/HybF
MHEAALVDALLRRVLEVADEAGARRVTRVSVRLGALCHLSAEHLAGHFPVAAAGTLAAGAELCIQAGSDPAGAGALDLALDSVEVES